MSGSIPKCQPFKWFDFYFLFTLVSVNFMGFAGWGKGDLRICSPWLLIFDFVSASYLLYDLRGKKEEEIRYSFTAL